MSDKIIGDDSSQRAFGLPKGTVRGTLAVMFSGGFIAAAMGIGAASAVTVLSPIVGTIITLYFVKDRV